MGKQLEEFLERNKKSILNKWLTLILEDYPPETRRSWKIPRDPFANPIGSAFSRGTEGMWEGLRKGLEPKDLAAFLDPMIHIRAIQDFSPSQAIGFVWGLKKIIREELKRDGGRGIPQEELWEMENRIDALGLMALDQYVLCRGKIYEIQLKELRSRTLRVR